jgi:hypothetical protein
LKSGTSLKHKASFVSNRFAHPEFAHPNFPTITGSRKGTRELDCTKGEFPMKGKSFTYLDKAKSGTSFPAHAYNKRTLALELVARGKRLRRRVRLIATGMLALGLLSAVFE